MSLCLFTCLFMCVCVHVCVFSVSFYVSFHAHVSFRVSFHVSFHVSFYVFFHVSLCVCVCCLRLALILNDRRTIDEALIRKSTLFSGRTLNYSAEFFYNPKAKGKTVCSIVMVQLPPISVLMGGARGCI